MHIYIYIYIYIFNITERDSPPQPGNPRAGRLVVVLHRAVAEARAYSCPWLGAWWYTKGEQRGEEKQWKPFTRYIAILQDLLFF